jgi:transcriptional regulator with GAF, ATPase, and Fis domain
VLERANATSSLATTTQRLGLDKTAAADTRFDRLLEIIKRLARERDLDRLLERITDAAVELSGAERGFVLLVDEHGQLAPHTVRSGAGDRPDPHVAFSRSIAEAVLIDGEPILTFNARDDRRLNDFMSVHKLMLKSVACIPISGQQGIAGVLYLEHRLRAGRFQEADLGLLMAFADQAAIALENARLWSDNERRQRELQTKNAELESARVEIERLLEARTEELEKAQRALNKARAELAGEAQQYGMIGQSLAMRRVFGLIERVRESSVSVVIEGESGTGKELVARAIHAGSHRRRGPFIAVNCGALPEHLLESELFGYVRGAFTGADRDKKGLFVQAHGGTLFLDEFADIPARMQLDLLRVLQEGKVRPLGAEADVPVDVRVISASNRSLKQLVAERKLREDLYYRLSIVEMRLPALRERSEDIPLLCEHFLSRVAAKHGTGPTRLSRAALQRVVTSSLPGNVRQLEHLLLSAAMMADGTVIEPRDLALADADAEQTTEEIREQESSGPSLSSSLPPMPADLSSHKQREKQRIIEALERNAWNRAKAATALGIPRRTFYRRLAEFGILD